MYMIEIAKFGIDLEVLSKTMGFLRGISNTIPMMFHKNGITIAAMDCNSIEYAKVEICSTDIVDYCLKYDKGLGVVIDTKDIMLEELSEIICTESHDPYDPRSTVIANVKLFDDKIEFHCPGNVIVWANVIQDYGTRIFRDIEQISDRINLARKDNSIKKSSIKLEQSSFDKICALNIHVHDNRMYTRENIMKTVRIMVDKDGLVLLSKSRYGSHELKTRLPDCTEIDAQRINDNDSEFLGTTIERERIIPFASLKGVSLITMEIRNEKPIILEQKISNGITAMLSVAPLAIDEKEEHKLEDIHGID